ncbi:hypothetical protein L2Y96_10495 [Luteibacter aegosomaticola]|uniref:hypothetical protein n=1 Tax=Luteibacter aegosomaticola TaxID=2911538 RepID=UPI001FFB1854|nr:hypothetical protein [Luteibacter aegosomaticola]UPG92168.1 hypothetical protein L2Y96_10495 [Luteibacter aegosomaticola]
MQTAQPKTFPARTLSFAACLLIATASFTGQAQEATHMAPVDAYLMDRTAEINLARSAAPPSIAKDATVLVLTRKGYETAVKGTNGFVCYVGRGFGGAPDWPERWDPKIKAAACDNPSAAPTMTALLKLRTAMTLAGKTDAEVMDRIKTALRTREIPPLAAGAICYMMSKNAYLSAQGDHNMAHLMFYVPEKDGTTWGANLPGSPVIGGNYWYLMPGHEAEAAALPPISVFLVATSTFSDGSPVSPHAM